MPALNPFAREVLDWMDAHTQDDHVEYNRRRKLVLAILDELKLKKLSDADLDQQQIIRQRMAHS